MSEVWLPINRTGGRYEVSNTGKVRFTVTKRVREKRGRDGYANLTLRDEYGDMYYTYVHREVALAFIGVPPAGKPQVDHIDGNRLNNHVTNLRYVSHAQNMRSRHVKTRPRQPLTEEQVERVRALLPFKTTQQIARELGINYWTVKGIRSGRTYRPSQEIDMAA